MNDNRAEQVFKDFDKWLDLVKNGEAEITNISVMRKPKPWVGLTDREKSNLWLESRAAIPRFYTYATLVEAKLKEKNT